MNRFLIRLVVFVLHLGISFGLQAQAERAMVAVYFETIQASNDIDKLQVQSDFASFNLNKKAEVLELLESYVVDSSALVRSYAIEFINLVTNEPSDEALKDRAITLLLRSLRDDSPTNVTKSLRYLSEFKKETFDAVAKDTLASIYRSSKRFSDRVSMLAGFVELTTIQPQLRAVVQNTTASKVERWAALLALSRMGDDSAVRDVLMRVTRAGINDNVVYDIFPDLIYTRNQEIFSYLIEVLNSDEKNCESADAEHGGKITCAYRVMEMLAPVIKDFPLKVDASGDIDAKDYQAALQTARKWFKENPNYIILKDRY